MLRIECSLPANFRTVDFLAFQRRDPHSLSEQVEPDCMRKGIVWAGVPACLEVSFRPGQACLSLAVDAARAPCEQELRRFAEYFLGLDQPIGDFEANYAQHPLLQELLATNAGLRVPQAASPFEALSWAISGQQISLAAALSLRRRLIETVGLRHSSGLYCYPDAVALAQLDEAALGAAGFSRSKAQTLLALSRAVCADELPLQRWWQEGEAPESIAAQLLAVRGIGPWTVDYTLLRGFAYLDGSLHGDAAVRRQLQRLLKAPERLDARFVQDWLLPFSPWRALLAAHLWAMP